MNVINIYVYADVAVFADLVWSIVVWKIIKIDECESSILGEMAKLMILSTDYFSIITIAVFIDI